MLDRYRAVLALTSLLLAAAPGHHRHAHRHGRPAVQTSAGIELYSRRALRRARTILQLKLLQLHALQLDRIRQTIERTLAQPATPPP